MTTRDRTVEEAEIRRPVDACIGAIRAKDVDGLPGPLRDGRPVVRPGAPPLESRGTDVYWRSLEEWFAFRGPIGYEIRDPMVTVADDVAFCHSLNRIKGRGRTERTPMSGCGR